MKKINLMRLTTLLILLLVFFTGCRTEEKSVVPADVTYTEEHRPQIHFSPKEKWMNDPNGMVYSNGTYHLFYQYYPDSTVWGPMHWGHATTKDLVHWEHQPIALYPDSLGYIFSGSAVVDSNNTSGFGKDGKPPMVAIFTHHDTTGEKAHTNTFQNQSIAYSLDEGKTWAKYANNPVLKNPGIVDFRDPKVSWYAAGNKWIMTLATKDHISFFSSKDLKDWKKESEFGATVGAHGGVWECPDLFPLEYNGQVVWVLLVSINPGGPNGGSATQYFTGNFDGKTFTPFQTDTRWVDYGTDNYAGVTWSNTGKRRIFLGWMSNWQYANVVPTQQWRSAMTIPRELTLEKVKDKFMLRSMPVPEIGRIEEPGKIWKEIEADYMNLPDSIGKLTGPVILRISVDSLKCTYIKLFNQQGEQLIAGYDKTTNSYYIDRTKSGKANFEKGFAAKHTAPRLSENQNLDLTIIIDKASIEMYGDNGLTVMTDIFFPTEDYTDITFWHQKTFKVKYLQINRLKSIWK